MNISFGYGIFVLFVQSLKFDRMSQCFRSAKHVTSLISRGDNQDRADSDPGTLSLFPSLSFGPSVSTSPSKQRCFTQRVCSRDVTWSNGIHPTSSTRSFCVCVHSCVFFALTSLVITLPSRMYAHNRLSYRDRSYESESCQNSFYLTDYTSNFAQFYTDVMRFRHLPAYRNLGFGFSFEFYPWTLRKSTIRDYFWQPLQNSIF